MRLDKSFFDAPIRSLMPPRMAAGHPANYERSVVMQLLMQVLAARRRAERLIGKKRRTR